MKYEPFSRCLCCNSLLDKAEKEKTLIEFHQSRKGLYEDFAHCKLCDKMYWAGTHVLADEKSYQQNSCIELVGSFTAME